ncbi:hypothetical protein KC723_01795 [Candidatus Kaiserbacteria bacterium]|nr:hypothetical protein [Candidatus Kaiserbacteria bacterium]
MTIISHYFFFLTAVFLTVRLTVFFLAGAFLTTFFFATFLVVVFFAAVLRAGAFLVVFFATFLVVFLTAFLAGLRTTFFFATGISYCALLNKIRPHDLPTLCKEQSIGEMSACFNYCP